MIEEDGTKQTRDDPIPNWKVFLVLGLILFLLAILIVTVVSVNRMYNSSSTKAAVQSQIATSKLNIDLTAVTRLESCKITQPLAISFGPSYDSIEGIALMVEKSKTNTPTLCGFIPANYQYNIGIAAGYNIQTGTIVISDLQTSDEWHIQYTLDKSWYILTPLSDDLFIDSGSVIFDSA